jgi:hypothetical protein
MAYDNNPYKTPFDTPAQQREADRLKRDQDGWQKVWDNMNQPKK